MADISNRDLADVISKDLDKRLEVLPQMQDSLHAIDKQLAVNIEACRNNSEDIDTLQDKSNRNDALVAVLSFVTATVAAIFGGRLN